MHYKQGKGSFGSNIPRFEERENIASQTSFRRDGNPKKIAPGHYQKSVTIPPPKASSNGQAAPTKEGPLSNFS